MKCSRCDCNNVKWMGPLSNLTHTECPDCGGQNCQVPEEATEEDNDTQAELAAWELIKSAREELAELKSYLCRIKLPVPVKLFSALCDNFPGKDVFCTEKDGYLCIYRKP